MECGLLLMFFVFIVSWPNRFFLIVFHFQIAQLLQDIACYHGWSAATYNRILKQ